jgi:hypothetical protein
MLLACSFGACAQPAAKHGSREISKVWDEVALADWATPLAGLNLPPTHISAEEYYSFTVENLRTYPLYVPGREPAGYWEMLQHVGPKPLIEPEKLKTEADWIEAGRRVFDEADHPHFRTSNPNIIAAARSRETFAAAHLLSDGTIFNLRWVPTKQGLALSTGGICSSCHVLYREDGIRIPGPSHFALGHAPSDDTRAKILRAARSIAGVTPFQTITDEPFGISMYRAFGVPWLKEDDNERLKSMTGADIAAFRQGRAGAMMRCNGSPFYPAKVPDLIGIKERTYLDHTATHLHRGIGDLMRYAALVTFADAADFGPHHMLSSGAKRVRARLPDQAL